MRLFYFNFISFGFWGFDIIYLVLFTSGFAYLFLLLVVSLGFFNGSVTISEILINHRSTEPSRDLLLNFHIV